METNKAAMSHIKDCLECHQICTETVAHVLHGGAGHSEPKHLVALLDCSQICLVCADFAIRQSPHHTHLCSECAEICKLCAELCEAHQDADGQMKRCGEACRRCAASCEKMDV
ncbi:MULTISPECIES: four-helix bundle copper-binding protein [unclassified Variovorax]|uniref:four-helix bundle copper-binding protein n=1 Tax=unclassified Variovorax TaxID=663243 RepID=UPI000A988E40|nr:MULTISPECIES: four-helix bundle copper-binding protein [unclassified Variovorax]VTV17831.1 hypothetical protein WDL1P1_00696 [Variovorax sp. WDL1]